MISRIHVVHGSSRRVVSGRSTLAKQRGSALIFALMTLVALMLAAVALVRSVDTSTRVLGNLGFKQDLTAAADKALGAAIASLAGQDLTIDGGARGYYATSLEGLDITGQQITPGSTGYSTRALVNWDIDNCAWAASGTWGSCAARPSDAVTVNANTAHNNSDIRARYLITRLCLTGGDPTAAGNSCHRPLVSSTSAAPPKGSLDFAHYERFAGVAGPYYRIVVRVVDGRGTTSFTETIVHF